MTTDPTPLQERIARALAAYEGFDAEHLDHEFVVGEWYATAEALVPLVAAEVRKGRAAALREAAPLMHDHHDAAWLTTQADLIETED